uniref:Mcl1_mid domain-containing protein n=1 Tax=Parastrongyloides trichosuri TaxID=131310 RepID=A0A0N4ZMN4_PARTI
MEVIEPIHAHFKGPVRIALNKKSDSDLNLKENLFVSVGCDNSIFYWSIDSRNNLQYREDVCTEENTSCIAWYDKNMFIGQTSRDPITENEQNHVTVIEYGKTIVNNTLTTFSFETCAIDCSNDGKYVVAASNDFVIKSIELNEKCEVIKYDKYCTDDPVLAVSISPSGKFFAAAFSNSVVHIYKTDADKDISGNQIIDPVGEFTFSKKHYLSKGDLPYSMTWTNESDNLFLPSDGGVNVISYSYESKTFSEDDKWISDEIEGENFTNCAISKKGDKLVLSSINGNIVVFDTYSGRVISDMTKPSTEITSLVWNPLDGMDDTLIICDKKQMTYLYQVKPKELSKSQNSFSSNKRKIVASDEEEDSMDYNDGEETNLSCDINKLKTFSMREDKLTRERYIPEMAVKYKPPKILQPFVVTSTPKTENGNFLKWNHHGIVKIISEGNDSYVEASFHDISVHGEFIIDNTFNNFTMGDISDKAIVLASTRDNKKNESKLFVKYFAAWDTNSRDWEVCFENTDESIVNIALSDNYIAIATSFRYVRIYSLAGVQLNIFCYNGPMVTMIMNDEVLVVARYDSGAIFNEHDSGIEYSLKMDFHFYTTVTKCSKSFPITLSPSSNLQFLLFTPDCNIILMDSKYNFFIFHVVSTTWIPVKTSTSIVTSDGNSIFPLFVTLSSSYELRYIYTSGEKYPLVIQKNAPQITTLEFPLNDKETDRFELENQLLMNKYFPTMKYVVNGQTTNKAGILLRLFALATGTNRLVRAIDIAKMADEEKIIQVLSNYAAKQKSTLLSEKVNEVGRKMVEDKKKMESKKNTQFDDVWNEDEGAGLNHPSPKNNVIITTPKVIMVPKRKYSKTPYPSGKHDESNLDSSIIVEEPNVISTQSSTTSEIPSVGKLYSSNPFKKEISSQASVITTNGGDFFDTLSSTGPITPTMTVKRKADALTSNNSLNVQKQAKLSFVSIPQIKPSSVYEYWKLKNEKSLREQYKGAENNEQGFIRFVSQKFRTLKEEERNIWAKEFEESQVA